MGMARNEYALRRRARERFGDGAKVVHRTDADGTHRVVLLYPDGAWTLASGCASTSLAYREASRCLSAPRRGGKVGGA